MGDDGDKRSVATDALATLGTILDDTQKRDAIHLAVEPVIAGEDHLKAGDHIDVRDGVAWMTKIGQGLGIVDPFLTKPVMKGDRFWFVMYPRMIRSLRHVWSHPAFPDEIAPDDGTIQVFDGSGRPDTPREKALKDKAVSEAWLRQYAKRVNHYLEPEAAYTHLLNDITNKAITYQGTDMHSLGELQDADELRNHASIVLGHEINWGDFEYFSCTC